MFGSKEKIWSLAAILLAVCVTAYTLSYIVTVPWHIIPGLAADSTKNNFTYLYHSLYGHGYWFEGMNYPYGEHIVYTDGVPLLSVFFAAIGNVGAGVALTVLWWLIGISYVLCMWFVYRILVHFKVSAPVAIIFSALIMVFSPQLFRIGGHYALSFLCVVPMLFYWNLKYNELLLRKYCVYIFLCGIVTAFLHPYFSAIVLVWGFFYVLAYVIVSRATGREKLRHVWPLLAAILGVFIIVSVVMKLTDPVTDRPLTPYGLLTYTTYKRDIFTSAFSPAWKYVREHRMLGNVVPHISEGSEGYTYLGLVLIAAVLFSIAMGVRHLLSKSKERIIVGQAGFSPIWLLMAVFALLFSMGVPYIWNMEWLLSRFTFLRQFRSLGRFSWIFYYIIAVYGTVVIFSRYRFLLARGMRFDGYAILLLAMGIWGYEASGYTKYVREIASKSQDNYDVYFSKKVQTWPAFMEEHQHKAADFQAILILGFFHIGSDKLWVGESGERMTQGGSAAYQLHLPIVDVMMSRSSLSQTMKQVKISSGPFTTKPLLQDIKSNKPFLLLRYDHDSMDEDQRYLLASSDYIGHYNLCSLYAFYPGRLRAADKKYADSVDRLLSVMTVADTCLANRGTFFIDHMDGLSSPNALFGAGAIPCINNDSEVVASIAVRPQYEGQVFEYSCWFQLSDKDYASPYILLESLDSAGNKIATDEVFVKNSVDNWGLWFRASIYFKLREQCRTIKCKLYNEPKPSYLLMDEMQLRPEGALIISKSGSEVMVNNHVFRKETK